MEKLQLFVLILLLAAGPGLGDHIAVFLGDPVKFTATETCQREDAQLVHRRADDSAQLVARFQDGVWKPGAGYEDRMEPNASVVLTRTNINDNGPYELPCANTPTQLEVVPFSALRVDEGDAVTLPCFYITTGKRVESVWWEKHGARVFEPDLSAGLPRGDFSWTLERARPEDGGDYWCYVRANGKKERGGPAPVRLTVNEGHTTATTPPPPCPTQKGAEDGAMETWKAVIIPVCVCAIVFFLLGWWLKSCCCKVSSRPGDQVKDFPLLNSPAGSRV